MTQIVSYSLAWSASQNRGFVYLMLPNNAKAQVEVDSAAELLALAQLLRTAHNIGFDPAINVLSTGFVPPGSP
jgi:hypothetical protein